MVQYLLVKVFLRVVRASHLLMSRAAQPQAKLLRLPEASAIPGPWSVVGVSGAALHGQDLPTSGQGSVPEFSEIVDKVCSPAAHPAHSSVTALGFGKHRRSRRAG